MSALASAYDHPEPWRLVPIAERLLGFTLREIHYAYKPGDKNAAQVELRARIDARLAELGDRGWDMGPLARIIGVPMRTLWKAQMRARCLRKYGPKKRHHHGRHHGRKHADATAGGWTGSGRGQRRRLALLRRDGPTCAWCGRMLGTGEPFSKPTWDHVLPKARGGNHTLDNACLSCIRCQHAKGDQVWLGVGRWALNIGCA